MKLRWKLLVVFIVVAVAPLLLVAILHFKFKHDVESYKKALLTKGEKLAISDWIPKGATNTEGGRIFLESGKPFFDNKRDHHPSPMRMVASGHAQVSWKAEEVYDWDFKRRTNIWPLIEDDFELNTNSLEALRDAAKNRQLVFPLAYEQGFRLLLPHLAKLKQGATWLSAATMYELHEGKKVEAAENLKALLHFVKNYKAEPLLISHLVHIACLQIAFNTTWEALQYPSWNDTELKEFQDAWAAISMDGLEEVFSMERAMGIQMFAEARESGQRPLQMVSGSGGASLLDDLDEFANELFTDPKAAFKLLLNRPNQKIWTFVLSYREELDLLKMWQVGLEANREMKKEKRFYPSILTLRINLDALRPVGEEFMFGDSRPMITQTMTKFASAEIAKQLAETACALHRYKLENHHFPSELKQLVPKVLASVPSDPIDGQPLRYRLNNDGTFLFYSIGENETDELGSDEPNTAMKGSGIDPVFPPEKKAGWIKPVHPMRALDWVWPLPATEEQASEWEKHQN